jgi:hypothetical protein
VEYSGTLHQQFINFKKAHDSIKEEVLYNIFIEFGGFLLMCLRKPKVKSVYQICQILSLKYHTPQQTSKSPKRHSTATG